MAQFEANEQVVFLRECPSKAKTANEIIESLGLKNLNTGSGPPTFRDQDVANLYLEIKRTVENFVKAQGTAKQEKLKALTEDSTFAPAITSISATFGEKIWGASHRSHLLEPHAGSRYPRALFWNVKSDRTRVQSLIRSWLVKSASTKIRVESRKPREGSKLQKSPCADRTIEIDENARELSDGEILEMDGGLDIHRSMANLSENTASGPRVQTARMYPTPTPQPQVQPHTNCANDGTGVLATPSTPRRPAETSTNHDELYDYPVPHPQNPPSVNKRKALDSVDQQGRVKLTKGNSYRGRAKPGTPKERQRGSDFILQSPHDPSDLFTLPLRKFGHRKQRQGSVESDPTYMPSEESNAESDTEPDRDSIMTEAQDLERLNARSSIILPTVDRVQAHPDQQHAPTAETIRRDSVIPDTQDYISLVPVGVDVAPDNPVRALVSTELPRSPPQTPARAANKPSSSLNTPEGVKQLRKILFKLLLSRLNSIHQFAPGVEEQDAEERLEDLLHYFWVQDQAELQSKLADAFPRLRIAFESWMDMRKRLRAFQASTRYFGQPGPQWKSHLKTISDTVERAKACIALADLTLNEQEVGWCSAHSRSFNDDLAIVFDQMTMFSSCNGAEEFKGVETYNAALRQWFS